MPQPCIAPSMGVSGEPRISGASSACMAIAEHARRRSPAWVASASGSRKQTLYLTPSGAVICFLFPLSSGGLVFLSVFFFECRTTPCITSHTTLLTSYVARASDAPMRDAFFRLLPRLAAHGTPWGRRRVPSTLPSVGGPHRVPRLTRFRSAIFLLQRMVDE